MPLYEAILRALIQGFTEFLPISSSGHLFLAPWLLGWKDAGLSFDIALHIGTLLAVLIYFFRDWVEVIARGLRINYGRDPQLEQNPNLLWLLAAASIPIGVLGLLFKKQAETTLRNPYVIAGMLISVGILMLIGERLGKREKTIAQVSWLDALVIGFAQALAIVPGTSRSGATMTAALFRDIDRPTAARFSFLLSTPAVGAAGAKAVYDAYKEGALASLLTTECLVGVAVSAITGCLVIQFFMNYLRRAGLAPFIYYRIAFGILVLALAIFRPQAG